MFERSAIASALLLSAGLSASGQSLQTAPPVVSPSSAPITLFAPTSVSCAGPTSGPGPGTFTTPCPTITINGEVFDPPLPPPTKGKKAKPNTFYGYADPSIRADPNSDYIYLAYSYAVGTPEANTAYGLHVIDLNLAHSTDGGNTWTKDGVLFQTTAFNTTPAAPPLAEFNVTSHETVDLFPFNYNGTTLWIQAHQEYLVDANGSEQLEGEQAFTNIISVTAIQGSTPAELLLLGNSQSTAGPPAVPEARLGNAYTNPVMNVTQNLSSLPSDTTQAAADCNSWTQQTMFQQAGTLYLAAQCTQSKYGKPSSNGFAFFVFSTQPYSGLPGVIPTDASTWPWSYVGVLATQANAQALWKIEGSAVQQYDPAATTYSFFTEMEFAMSSDGVDPIVILSPSQFAKGQSQAAIQYGCRAVKVYFNPLRLDLSASGNAPNVLATVTEQDLYTSPNLGPGACAYEPQSADGIILVHKVEGSPHWSTLMESLSAP